MNKSLVLICVFFGFTQCGDGFSDELGFITLIFSNDKYGLSLLENFEKIGQQFEIEIKGKWAWDHEKNSTEQIERIQKELVAIDDPGVIYLATHAAEGTEHFQKNC